MGGGIVEVERTQETPPLRFAPGFNVAVPFIDRHVAEGRGRKAAIRTLHGDVTYAALATGVDRCAGVLVGLGLQPGERMLMVVKDCPAFFYLFWGAIKAGIIPVPVNTLLRQATYAFMIDDSGAAAIVYSPEFAAEVEPGIASAARRPRRVLRTDGDEPSLATLLARSGPRFDAVPADAEDDCFWLYSSGSTGQPKAAVHRHRDMAVTSQRFGVETLGITSDDVCYSEAKLFFAYGLGNNMLPRIVGAGRAADLLYSGRAMDGVEAERWGVFQSPVRAGERARRCAGHGKIDRRRPDLRPRHDQALHPSGMEHGYRRIDRGGSAGAGDLHADQGLRAGL